MKKNKSEKNSDFSTSFIKKEAEDEENYEENYEENSEENYEDDLESLKKETETSDGSKIYYCKKCDQTFKKQASLDGHILR